MHRIPLFYINLVNSTLKFNVAWMKSNLSLSDWDAVGEEALLCCVSGKHLLLQFSILISHCDWT